MNQNSNPFDTLHSELAEIKKIVNELKADKKLAGKTSPTDELLTIKQASEYLNLALPTIYALASKREIPHAKRGKKLYFNKSELRDWVLSGKRKMSTDIAKDATLDFATRSKKGFNS